MIQVIIEVVNRLIIFPGVSDHNLFNIHLIPKSIFTQDPDYNTSVSPLTTKSAY